MGMVLITGNTYPVREAIKALAPAGAIYWNRAAQGWNVPAEVAEKARAIVDAAGPARERSPNYAAGSRRTGGRKRYGSNYGRASNYGDYDEGGGREHYTNKRGRCEDAPCCGCCS